MPRTNESGYPRLGRLHRLWESGGPTYAEAKRARERLQRSDQSQHQEATSIVSHLALQLPIHPSQPWPASSKASMTGSCASSGTSRPAPSCPTAVLHGRKKQCDPRCLIDFCDGLVYLACPDTSRLTAPKGDGDGHNHDRLAECWQNIPFASLGRKSLRIQPCSPS